MKITIAKDAGYCFGVRDAVDLAYKTAEEYGEVYMLGDIVHNENVIHDLDKSGAKVIDDINEIPEDKPILLRAHGTKKDIDWKQRERDFSKVIENAKSNSIGYDCLIPVSGGKDSTWQVVKCLEYGLNPLAVTWKTPARTKIGQTNLDNLVNLGVDHIDYQVNPAVERKFILSSFKKYGSTAIPMHMAIFNIPIKIAVQYNIPLIIWGENSAFEYGGEYDEQKGFTLDRNWLLKYGVTHGTTAENWVSEDLSRKELTPYFSPSEIEIEKAGVLAIFLGFYFKWDVEVSLDIALLNGFKVREDGPKVGIYNYADIDCDFISIHHWLKWYKFGITRTMDNLSLEIRNGRMSRKDAIKILGQKGDETPLDDIRKFCSFVGVSTEDFFKICEQFRNTDIWRFQDDVWQINDFLINDWVWE